MSGIAIPPYRFFAVLMFLPILVLPACAAGKEGIGNFVGPDRSVVSPQRGSHPDAGGADVRRAFLGAVNKARSVNRRCGNARYGSAPPVSWSGNLAKAARLHSEDMAAHNFFGHTGSDGSSAGQRISREGYPWSACGENIAVGVPTASSVVQGWLESEGHCRNLMSAEFTEIGAGYAIGPYAGDPDARFWTLDLATGKGKSGRTIR